MKKILLKIEYDGSRYHGWQIQPNGITVEEVIEQKLRILIGNFVKVNASSRTDAGVHALGQPATIHIPEHISIGKLFLSLNALLPNDIAITDMVRVEESFCVRKSNHGKRYRYQINNCRIPQALEKQFYWWVKDKLDKEAMAKAATELIGKRDFLAFQGKGGRTNNSVKEITKVNLEWKQVEKSLRLYIVIEGSAFLKHMVRNIVGTLVEIGKGKIPAETFQNAFRTLKRKDLGMTAPANGLFLEHVFYDPDPFVIRKGETWDNQLPYEI